MFSKILQKKKGFTLVEMIIYVAIAAIILLVIFNMVLVIARSNKEFRASRNIQNAAITSIERMTRDIQDAASVSTAQSTLGSHPGSLYMSVENSAGSTYTIEYVLTNGRIHVLQDGTDIGPITPSNVEVSNLVFYVGSTGLGQMVRFEVTIDTSLGTVSKSENFYMTTVVRGSY